VKGISGVIALSLLAAVDACLAIDPAAIWLSEAEIDALPTSGPAWTALVATANAFVPVGGVNGSVDIGDPQDDGDMDTLACALVYVRTGNTAYRTKVATALAAVMGTENDENGNDETDDKVRAVGFNLPGYVIAAGLIHHDVPAFTSWISGLRTANMGESRDITGLHRERPNNIGTTSGGGRIAASMFVGDEADVAEAAAVFTCWMEGTCVPEQDFDDEIVCWHADVNERHGINPAGAVLGGISVDGVLPDDQRRQAEPDAGDVCIEGPCCAEPPCIADPCCPPTACCENYVRTALNGAMLQAALLDRWHYAEGWSWGDEGLRRAMDWVHEVGCAGQDAMPGNDEWMPWLANWAYGTDYPTVTPIEPGRTIGFTDWTHASCRWDFNADGAVGVNDMLALFGAWGAPYAVVDLLQLFVAWGPCRVPGR
jgi:hypothetical protein